MAIINAQPVEKEHIRTAFNNLYKNQEASQLLVFGLATSGPINTPVSLTSVAQAERVFDSPLKTIANLSVGATTITLDYTPTTVNILELNATTGKFEAPVLIKNYYVLGNILHFDAVISVTKILVSYRVSYDRYCLVPKINYAMGNGITSITAVRTAGEHISVEIPSVVLEFVGTNTAASPIITSTTAVSDTYVGFKVYKHDDFSVCKTIVGITGNEITVDSNITSEYISETWVLGCPIYFAALETDDAEKDSEDPYYITSQQSMRSENIIEINSPLWTGKTSTFIPTTNLSTIGAFTDEINRRYKSGQTNVVAYTDFPLEPLDIPEYTYIFNNGNNGSIAGTTFACDTATWFDSILESLDHVDIGSYEAVEITA